MKIKIIILVMLLSSVMYGQHKTTISAGGGTDEGGGTVNTSGVITGIGTIGSPIKLQDGTVVNQVPKWNGSAWVIDTISTGGSSGPVSWNDLTDVPAGFADDIDNTASGGSAPAWGEITGIPAGFDDDTDDVNDADSDASNEFITAIDINSGNLRFSEGSGTNFQTIALSQINIDELPNQATHATKSLYTDGSSASWQKVKFTDLDFTGTTGFDDLADNESSGGGGTAWGDLTSVPSGFADNTDDVNDADADNTNELQNITSTANGSDNVTIGITSGTGFNLYSSTGSDNATRITKQGDHIRLQTDLSDYLKTVNAFDGVFSSLTSIPTGLSDGDDDTQLSQSDIEAMGFVVGAHTTNTDNQTIDVHSLTGDRYLNLSLSGDGEATKLIDLAPINTDDQTLAEVLAEGTSAGNYSISSVNTLGATTVNATNVNATDMTSLRIRGQGSGNLSLQGSVSGAGGITVQSDGVVKINGTTTITQGGACENTEIACNNATGKYFICIASTWREVTYTP